MTASSPGVPPGPESTGLLRLLDDPRRQRRAIVLTVGGAIANGLFITLPVAFLFDEPLFGWVSLAGFVAYAVGFAQYLLRGSGVAMVHLIVWSSLVINVVGTVVAGGLVGSGGFILWGLINAVMAVLFLERRWAAAVAIAYGLATLGLFLADPWLRAARPAPDPWFSTIVLVDVLVGSLVFMVPLTMRLVDQLRTEHERARTLMLNILPESVADRLKADETVVDALPSVTTIFADISGFTAASEAMTPDAMVAALNEVFTRFDAIADRHGLEKIKTIGDGYHAAAGVPDQRPDHLESSAEAALEMLEATEGLTYGDVPLAVRIGMDTGPVVAAVIGTSKFSYDLWGDSVNTASRMESHGEPGRIHVTGAVRDGLGDRYSFTARGPIEVKSKGSMETWFLDGRRDGGSV